MSELQNGSAFSAMLHVRDLDNVAEANASDSANCLEAARLSAQISNEHQHLEAKLLAMLSQWQHENADCPTQTENLKWADWAELLQEHALALIYSALRQANMSTENRVVIALNANGELQLKQPQNSALENTLAQAENLRNALLQLTALDLADHALQNLEQALGLLQNNSHGKHLLYQACLQGALSHFHLLKQ